MPRRSQNAFSTDLFAPLPALRGAVPEVGDAVAGGADPARFGSADRSTPSGLRSPSQRRAFIDQFNAAMDMYNSIAAGSGQPAQQVLSPPRDATGDAAASRVCSQCGAVVATNDRFCRQCGMALPATVDARARMLSPTRRFSGGQAAEDDSLRDALFTQGRPEAEQPQPRGAGRLTWTSPPPPERASAPPDFLFQQRRAEAIEAAKAARDGSEPVRPTGFDAAVVRMLMREREQLKEKARSMGDERGRIEREKSLLGGFIQEGQQRLDAARRQAGSRKGRQHRRSEPQSAGSGSGGWEMGGTRNGLPPPHLMPQSRPRKSRSRRSLPAEALVRRSRSAPHGGSARDRAPHHTSSCEDTTESQEESFQQRRVQDLEASLAMSSLRRMTQKERIQQANRSDTTLRTGYFQPEDLRGSVSFPRTPRFNDLGVRDPGVAFYFLDDAVQDDIKDNRRRSRSATARSPGGSRRRPTSTSDRGKYGCNVTNRWGLGSSQGGGNAPGPGSYDPLWAKITVRGMT